MLPSTGYFKMINCPFYDCALCERPYCHFRHVKKDPSEFHVPIIGKEEKTQGLFNYDNPAEESFSILVSEALKREPEQQQGNKNISVTPTERVASQEVNDFDSAVHRTELIRHSEGAIQRCQQKVYLPPAGIPDYKPTPIAELKKRHILVPCSSLPTFKKSRVQIKHSSHSKDVSFSKNLTNDTNCLREMTVIHDSEESLAKKLTYNKFWSATSPSHGDVHNTNLSTSCVSNSVNKFTISNDGNDLPPAQEKFLSTSNANVKTEHYFSKNYSAVDMDYKVTENLESNQIVTESNSEEHKPNEDVEVKDLSLSDEFNELENILSDNYINSPKAEEELDVESSTQCFGKTLHDLKLQNAQDSISGAKVEPKDARVDSSGLSQYSTPVVSSKRTNEETEMEKSPSIKFANKKDKVIKNNVGNKITRMRERENVTKTEMSPSIKLLNKKHKGIKTNKERKYSNLNVELKEMSSCKTESAKLVKNIDRHCSLNHIPINAQNTSTSTDTSVNNEDPSLPNLGSHTNKTRPTVFGINKCEHKNVNKQERSGSNEESCKEFEENTKHIGIASPRSDCKTSESEELTQYLMSDSGTDEETINEECYRIFQEYEHHALPPQARKLKMEGPLKKDDIITKKRIAHEGANYHPAHSMSPSKTIPNPIEIMHSRIAKLQESNKEKHDKTSINNSPSNVHSCTSPVASLPSGSSISVPKRVRIAHVPNVSMLLNEKLRIQMIIQQRKLKATTHYQSFQNCNVKARTMVQTLQKGAGRVAHKPSGATMHQPKLSGSLGGKVPTNVRQKYLKHLISEYAKLYLIDEEASTKAAKEEALIHEHSSSRSIYSSKMSNKINCIRKQVKQQTETRSKESSKSLSSATLPAPSRSKDRGSWSIVRRHKTSPGTTHVSFYAQMLSFMLTEELLCSNGFPRPHPKEKGMAIVQLQESYMKNPSTSSTQRKLIRTCSRCGCSYRINESGFQVTEEQCTYHWGKLYKKNIKGQWDHSYTCCGGDCETGGCVVSSCHVSDNFDSSNLRGFVKTLPMESDPPNGDYGVYALDCEMCYTTGGLELTRVTVIDRDLDTVYESLVKPKNPIIDYNTKFSGITEDDLKHVVTTILDVQAALLSLFNEKTILIGHSLESDLKVLKLIHSAVVDTSVVFPHKMGPPKKRALKTLCWEHLNKIIQESESGHDSAEDAKACMELMKWKVSHCNSR